MPSIEYIDEDGQLKTVNISGLMVKSVQEKIREDFATVTLSNFWDAATIGPGMSVDLSQASALRVISGTTPNSETILRSKRAWRAPFRVMFLPLLAQLLSQRIANQEIELRVATADGADVASWLFDGTSATTGKLRSRNGGTTMPADTTVTGLLDTGSGSAGFEIEMFIDEVYYHCRAADNGAARSASYVRNRQIPDPSAALFLEIRVRNLATAPASSTVLQLDSVLVQDISELTTEVTGGRGGGAASQGVPVVSAGGANLPVTLGNVPGVIPRVGQADTTINNAALAASGTFTQSTAVDLGSDLIARANRERLVVKADAAALGGVASLVLQESTDGSVYREVYRSPLPLDSSAHSYDVPIRTRYRRWLVANGTTAITQLFIQSRLFQFDGQTDQHENIAFPLTPTAGSALAASATFLGPGIDLGANHMWDKMRAWFTVDQAAQVLLQQSLDGITWFSFATASPAAGAAVQLETLITSRYVRVAVVNSTTAMAALRVVAALVSL